MICPCICFSIFSKFWFFGLLVGWKGKKWPKMTKHSVFCTPYLRSHTSCKCHLWYTCVKWYLHSFFFFFFSKILIFWVVRLVKGQKMVQNVKKSVCCTQYLKNHISYDHHLWYTSVKWWYLHACLLFFSKFWFSKLLGGEMAKNGPKWQKIMSIVLNISGIKHMIIICGIQV